MRAVIYIRVSSDVQVKNSSLSTQEQVCGDYCARNEWDIVRVFREEGESAKTDQRPEFLALLDYCRSKKNAIDYLVVYSTSRFSRNRDDHIPIAAKLRMSSVKLRSATEPVDESTIGKFMETVLTGMN